MFEDRPGSQELPPAQTDADTAPPAVERFRSCRWAKLAESDTADHCTHRDVLPFAGANGFAAEAWCLDCTYYKLRRSARRSHSD